MKEVSSIQALVLTPEKLAELREPVRKALPAEQAEIICACLEIPARVVQLLQEKNMAIAKLRWLVFGASTESSKNLGGKPPLEFGHLVLDSRRAPWHKSRA